MDTKMTPISKAFLDAIASLVFTQECPSVCPSRLLKNGMIE